LSDRRSVADDGPDRDAGHLPRTVAHGDPESDCDCRPHADSYPRPPPSATPVATTPPPATVAFGSRPLSGPITLSGAACQNVTISNRTFRALGTGVIAINLSGCNGVTIDRR
jgi:hypothetical protein